MTANHGTTASSSKESKVILEVKNLRTEFVGRHPVVAVDDVSLELRAGEILGLVGETGSGKSVLVKSLVRILPPNGRITSGQIFWRGEDITSAPESRLRQIRGTSISMIFQNPQASLNPAKRIGAQLCGLLTYHGLSSRADARAQAIDLLRRVRIPDPERVLCLYPSECSGGMCQRVCIAMALSHNPSLLIADEPTTALDVTIQAQILQLIMQLRCEHEMAVLLVSHDLGVVSSLCDRVAVLWRGHIVESGRGDELFVKPTHPYTQELLQSSLLLGKEGRVRRQSDLGPPQEMPKKTEN